VTSGPLRGLIEFAAVSAAAAAATAAYFLAAPTWALPLAAVGAWSTLQVAVVRPLVRAGSPTRSRTAPPSPRLSEFDASIAEVRAASARILMLSSQARDPLVREHGKAITSSLNRVIAHLQEDPDDLATSQRFLAVYIERTKAILARYIQYQDIATPQAEEVRRKVRDELLPALVGLCDGQLQRITFDDIRSLETDVEVLRKSIQLEGL